MNNLDKLIEAVELDVATSKLPAPDCKILGKQWTRICNAYCGSLNAALALHEALLPGWKWGIHEPSPGVFRAYVCPWCAMRPMPKTQDADTPARAFLLAILKAYRTTLND